MARRPTSKGNRSHAFISVTLSFLCLCLCFGQVYELVGSRWTDRGTASCTGDYDPSAEEARLVARSEDTLEIILNCVVRVSDVYQRQQDTLIVWTEPDGSDFALSFQDRAGCNEVWEFIMEVQKHLSGRGMQPRLVNY